MLVLGVVHAAARRAPSRKPPPILQRPGRDDADAMDRGLARDPRRVLRPHDDDRSGAHDCRDEVALAGEQRAAISWPGATCKSSWTGLELHSREGVAHRREIRGEPARSTRALGEASASAKRRLCPRARDGRAIAPVGLLGAPRAAHARRKGSAWPTDVLEVHAGAVGGRQEDRRRRPRRAKACVFIEAALPYVPRARPPVDRRPRR